MKKKLVSLFLTLCMIVTLLPTPALAAESDPVTLDISSGDSIIITAAGYSVDGRNVTAHTGAYILTGTSDRNMVMVVSGSHTITMRDLSITSEGSPFSVENGATVTLTLEGENSLRSSSSTYAGVHVPQGATLTVSEESTGSLAVRSYYLGAGIGGNAGENAGTITIHGGTIEAVGGVGAGIGGGGSYTTGTPAGSGGHITITGGYVTASSNTNNRGAGIGGGGGSSGGSAGTIEISGGCVCQRQSRHWLRQLRHRGRYNLHHWRRCGGQRFCWRRTHRRGKRQYRPGGNQL